MANLKKPKTFKIGIIAEDSSDVEVFKKIFLKYLPDNRFSTQKFVGEGCGKIRSKCGAWVKNLIAAGCDYVVVAHDLDRHKEKDLRQELNALIHKEHRTVSVVVIPTEELEAWLLADIQAIKKVFSIKAKIKQPKQCESINSPKEFIKRLVYSHDRKVYMNSIHNAKIADLIQLGKYRSCDSFAVLDTFLRKNLLKEKIVEELPA